MLYIPFHREQATLLWQHGKSFPSECNAKLLKILFSIHIGFLLCLVPFLICQNAKKAPICWFVTTNKLTPKTLYILLVKK